MTDHLLHARLFNAGDELIAEGPCWLDAEAGRATLEPEREPGHIQKERGRLTLQLDSGRSLTVSDTPLVFKVGPSADGSTGNGHRSLYRLQVMDHAQEASTAGAADEGSAAPPQAGLHAHGRGETPAVR